MKSRSEFENNFEWLYYLQNNLGNNDLEIQCSWLKDKDIIWSKRRKVLDVLYSDNEYNRKFVENATHRSILDIEIVLDIDEPHPNFKTIKEYAMFLCDELKNYEDIKYFVYFTGSKSYHIHIFAYQLKELNNRDDIKKLILRRLKVDLLKVGRNMIAIEGQPHYKSGKIKKEVKWD